MRFEKFYLAARYARKDEMLRVERQLQDRGFTSVSSWLRGEDSDKLGDYAKYAERAIESVAACDVFIIFSESPTNPIKHMGRTNGGRHVEEGIALALGKPIVVVGPQENIFEYGNRVTRVNDLRQLFEVLQDACLGARYFTPDPNACKGPRPVFTPEEREFRLRMQTENTTQVLNRREDGTLDLSEPEAALYFFATERAGISPDWVVQQVNGVRRGLRSPAELVQAERLLRRQQQQAPVSDAPATAWWEQHTDKSGPAEPTPEWQGLRVPGVVADALRATQGSRRRDYEPPSVNFGRIATLWNALETAGLKEDEELVGDDAKAVAQKMILFKLARLLGNPTHRDTIVDIIGYTICYAEIVGVD